jgi:cytochrome P450
MTADAVAASLPPEAEMRFDVGATEDSLDRMRELYALHGDAYRIWSPGRKSHTWVFNHPDDVRRILITNHRNYTRGVGFDRIKILLGNGIIVSEGDFWKRQRRLIQPTFHRRVLARFGGIIAAGNDACLARWEAQAARGESINVTDDMSILTLEILLRAIFGSDLDTLVNEGGENPFACLTETNERDLKFAYRFRKLAGLIQRIVAHRRAQPAPGEEAPNYVAMLLAARDKETGTGMSDKELVDELTTMIIAGHETTAAALHWTWYLLSQHPECEARLHAELDATPDVAVPELDSMEQLSYTNRVLQEAMRLYPPVWVISRRTIEADTLGGYTVPANTDVFISPYFIHRHPQFWQDGDAFNPDRVASDADADRPRLTYLPFSAGPHHCVGETLALYEMLVHVSKVARRFRLVYEPRDAIEFEALINLRTRRPIFMRLEPRATKAS